MRKLIDDGPDCEPAVHMKGGLKAALGEQESIDAPHAKRFDIGRVPHSRQVTRGFRFSFHVVGSPRTTFTASAG